MIKYLRYVSDTSNYCPDVTFQVLSHQYKKFKRYYDFPPSFKKGQFHLYFLKSFPTGLLGNICWKLFNNEPGSEFYNCVIVAHLGHPMSAYTLDYFNEQLSEMKNTRQGPQNHLLYGVAPPLPTYSPPQTLPQLLFAFMPHCIWTGIWTPSLFYTMKIGTGL